MTEIYLALAAMQFLWLVGLTFKAWAAKPGEDAARAAMAASVAADLIKGRMDVLEERIKHMPNSQELTELEGTVRAIKSTLDGMAETMAGLRATMALVQQFLLTERNK